MTKNKGWAVSADKIKKLRKYHDIPIAEMLELLGMNNKSTYLSYEAGNISFTPEMVVKLSKRFDVSCELLLDDTKKIDVVDMVGRSEKITLSSSENIDVVVKFLKEFDSLDKETAKAFTVLMSKYGSLNKDFTYYVLPKSFSFLGNNKNKSENIISIDEVIEREVVNELDLALQNPDTRNNAIKIAKRFCGILARLIQKNNLKQPNNKTLLKK